MTINMYRNTRTNQQRSKKRDKKKTEIDQNSKKSCKITSAPKMNKSNQSINKKQINSPTEKEIFV